MVFILETSWGNSREGNKSRLQDGFGDFHNDLLFSTPQAILNSF